MIQQQGRELRVSRDISKLLDEAHGARLPNAIRLGVQGLRAVAVLAVLAFHVNSAWLSAGFVGIDVIFVISGFLFAWLSYRFVESPIRKISGICQPLPKWTAAAICFVALVIFARHMNGRLVEPLPVEMTRYAPPKLICDGVQVGDCKRGSADVAPSVLVIGDSHASQLGFFSMRSAVRAAPPIVC